MKGKYLSKTWDSFPILEVYVDGVLINSTACHPDIAASLHIAESSMQSLEAKYPGAVVAIAFGLPPNTLRSTFTAV